MAGDSGYLVEELDLVRWSVGERLGFLSRKLQTAADRPGGGKVGDEGEYSHLSAAEGTQQRVDLIDPSDQLRPTEPGLAGEGVDGVLRAWPGAGRFFLFDLAPLAAGSIGVEAPVARSAHRGRAWGRIPRTEAQGHIGSLLDAVNAG